MRLAALSPHRDVPIIRPWLAPVPSIRSSLTVPSGLHRFRSATCQHSSKVSAKHLISHLFLL
jgi:hypothetical protein